MVLGCEEVYLPPMNTPRVEPEHPLKRYLPVNKSPNLTELPPVAKVMESISLVGTVYAPKKYPPAKIPRVGD